MSSERIENLKQEVLSKNVLEHFENNRKLIQKNLSILSSLQAPMEATPGEKAIVIMLSTLGCKIYDAFLTIENDMELSVLSSAIQRKRIERISDILNQQGVELDEIKQYEDGLRWIDEYIKHSADDKSLE